MALKLWRRKEAHSWTVRGTYLGVRVWESTGTRSKAVAERILKQKEREIEGGGEPTVGVTFAEACESYLKTCPTSEIKYVMRLMEHFGDSKLCTRIDQAAINAAAEVLQPGHAPSTQNRHVFTPCASVLHHAHERFSVPWMRVKKRKEPKGRDRTTTPENAAKILAALPIGYSIRRSGFTRWPRAAALFLLTSGARVTEMTKVYPEHVDLRRGEAVLEHTKNGETYTVALHSDLVTVMQDIDFTNDPVFGYSDRWQFYEDWRPACTEVGEVGLTPHMARHSFATWLRQGGADLKLLMELGRWKSVQSVMRYQHVTADEHRPAIENLPIGAPSVHDTEKEE